MVPSATIRASRQRNPVRDQPDHPTMSATSSLAPTSTAAWHRRAPRPAAWHPRAPWPAALIQTVPHYRPPTCGQKVQITELTFLLSICHPMKKKMRICMLPYRPAWKTRSEYYSIAFYYTISCIT